MKKILVLALASISLQATYAHASHDLGQKVQQTTDAFDADAKKFGSSIKNVSNKVKSEILSGATQTISGPSGEAVMLVGGVTAEAGRAVASAYQSTQGGLECLAEDPLNPFKDSGCVVQYAGETLVLGLTTASNGSQLLVVSTADALSETFNGFSRIMDTAADKTGRSSNPVGTLFVLTYNVSEAGESILRFALIDVVSHSVSILTDEGTALVNAPIDALKDVVTLKWKRAGSKLINLPVKLINSLVNIPARIIFGSKAKDATLKMVSPLGRIINRTLNVD